MKQTIEMMLMTLVIALMAVFVGTTLTACSSDDNEPELIIDPVDNPLLGYWLSDACSDEDVMHQDGLLFKADGTIHHWEVTPEAWSEQKAGEWGFQTEQAGIWIGFSITDNSYSIKSLTQSRLVIDHLNGWTMEHSDMVYRKMHLGPYYIN